MPGEIVEVGRENLARTNIAQTLSQLAENDELRHDAYEVRFLDLPPLGRSTLAPPVTSSVQPGYVERDSVIWLKCASPDGDLIYSSATDPIIKKWTGLEPGKLYTVQEFLKAVQPAVKAFHDREPGVH